MDFSRESQLGIGKLFQVIPLNFNCSLCRKIKDFSPLLSLAAPNQKIPTVFPGLTPKIPPWMCQGPCAGIISLGFPCSTGDPWSREHQALFRIPNVPFPSWNREFLGSGIGINRDIAVAKPGNHLVLVIGIERKENQLKIQGFFCMTL